MFRLFCTFLLMLGFALPLAADQLEASVSSSFLVRGERAKLLYVLGGSNDTDSYTRLVVPEVQGLTIRPDGYGAEPRLTYGRRQEYVFSYTVISYQPGTYTIPPARLEGRGAELTSDPVELRIMDETQLEWSTVNVGGREIRYSAAFMATRKRPFVNEVQPVELKVYFPANQQIRDWGIPEFERDGVAAWRFEPRPMLGRVRLLNDSYYCISYPSSLAPTRPGVVRIGPGKLRLITTQISLEDFGRAFPAPANLEVPGFELEARPLPEGAPKGFEDAVGRFELSVRASETQVHDGDPVDLTLAVSGTGNLDTLNPPAPVTSEGWRLYPPQPMQRADRRAITGTAAFRQFMRPLGPQTQVPSFRLVYFDPDAERYETLLSPPISLTVLPSTLAPALGAAAPPEMPVPVEQMTDILGVVNRGSLVQPLQRTVSPWLWQLVPAAIAALLLAATFRRHLAPRLHRDPVLTARRRAFRQVERAGSDQQAFYRAAGHFVERWLGESSDATVRDVLARRDETCFRPEGATAPVAPAERQKVLRELRRLALPLLLLAASLALTPAARAGEEAPELPDPATAYEDGRYGEAARLWLESGPYERLSADTLFNVGNAAYRLGSPGDAALYWRRALLRDETHAEARQNLRFFERKFGSIVIKRPDYQYVIARLPLRSWVNLIIGGSWLFALGLLVFPATRAGARLRVIAIAGMVTAPLLAATGFCGWYYYPDDARFAPPAEQVIVVGERVTIHTDAARNAPAVIEAPAGSLCHLLSESGEWAYVAFTNDTRGWVLKPDIERLVPDGAPSVPRARTSIDEEKSA